MKPTKEDAEKIMRWLVDPDNKEEASILFAEVAELIYTRMRKLNIL